MRTTILYLLLPLIFLCSCEKATEKPKEDDKYGVYNNFGTSIKIVDGKGMDLLNSKSEKHYSYDDIDVIEFKGKTAVPYFNSDIDSPKGYSFGKFSETSNKLTNILQMPFDVSKGLTSLKHLRIGKNGKIYSLKGEAKVFGSHDANSSTFGGQSTVTEKIWLDGELVWEGKDLLPAERNPVITIVIPE